MIKKCFVITMFGSSFDWINEYIDNVQQLEKYGWYWKIFTPNKIESRGNVEIIDMNTGQFNDLVEKKLGVRPNLFLTESGKPSVHITDFYIYTGVIFEDYLKDADFWGITNLDVVYGRLDHFISDDTLKDCEVFSDDVNTINGVFSLFKNTPKVNNLFRIIEQWPEIITQPECIGCKEGDKTKHTLYGSDEYIMTDIMRLMGKDIAFRYPTYYPMLSHDRLEHHLPEPKLEIKDDGSLWELFRDVNGPDWEHARPHAGREVFIFHFNVTKRWPECLK